MINSDKDVQAAFWLRAYSSQYNMWFSWPKKSREL